MNNTIKSLEKSLQLNPKQETVWAELGDTYYRAKDWQKAFDAYQNALKLNNQNPFVYKGLGMIFYNTGNHQEALNHLLKSLELHSQQAVLNYIIATIFMNAGHNLKSLGFFENEIKLGTNIPELYLAYGETLQKIGKVSDGVKLYKRGLRMKPFKNGYSNLMHMVHHDPLASNADFKELAEECYRLCLEPIKSQIKKKYNNFKDRDFNPKKKLRLGFFTYRFRFAAADYWALNIFKEMDKDDLELVLYHDSNFEDHGTQEFKDIADEWKETHNLQLEEVAEMINQDRIDVLVDMIGHMGGGRLELFALKAAPIQLCWLNYYGTLGMPEMDYFIGDRNIVTQEAEKFFVEKVYKMPKVFNPFTPKGTSFEINITDTLPFKRNGYITFGSLNRFSKVNDQVIKHWSQILKAVPNSKLLISATVFKEPEMHDYVKHIFNLEGIDKERIITEDYPELKEFFLKFNEIDICLDPFPFVGGATSIDAAYMGVPTVTITGPTWVHRSGVSTFINIEAEELIAVDQNDCLNKVVALATNIEKLEWYRQNLRTKLLESPLCDSKEYAKDFQQALRFMWEETCKNNSGGR